MNNNRGALLLARNNSKLDYVKQAVFSAERIKKYLGISVAVATDDVKYLNNLNADGVFDIVIDLKCQETHNNRRYHDGTTSSHIANFKNDARCLAYDLTPYNETLLLDTDFIICNDVFTKFFESKNDFLIYKNSSDVAKVRDEREFQRISDTSIDFYWATVVFFKKTELNRVFFDLVKHIQEEWNHYRRIYQLESPLFRNDYAFSIAIHIMNGFQQGDFATPIPGTKLYTTDKDILWKIDEDELTFLVEKKNRLGEYTLLKTNSQNVHVMNKFSLERLIDEN